METQLADPLLGVAGIPVPQNSIQLVTTSAFEALAVCIRVAGILGGFPAYLVLRLYAGYPGWTTLFMNVVYVSLGLGALEAIWFFLVQIIPGFDTVRQSLIYLVELLALWLSLPFSIVFPDAYFSQAAFLGDVVLCRMFMCCRRPGYTEHNNNPIISAAMERNTMTLRELLGTGRHPPHPDHKARMLGKRLNRLCCPRASFLEQENAIYYAQNFLDQGAMVDYPDDEGRTALQHAAEHGWPRLADLLLHAGADIEHPDHNGHTAMHIAAWHGRFDMIDFLLKWGANLAALDEYGNTAFMIAHEHVGMDRELCNAATSWHFRGIPMENDRTCCSSFYEELWKFEGARDDLAKAVGLGERRHWASHTSGKVACLTGEYEQDKEKHFMTIRLFSNFKTPYRGRGAATRFCSVLAFGPDGGCDLAQTRREKHRDFFLSLCSKPILPESLHPATWDVRLPQPTYDELWAAYHSNDREEVLATRPAIKQEKVREAWQQMLSLVNQLTEHGSSQSMAANEAHTAACKELERLLQVTSGSPALSSGRKLRRKRQNSALFWAIVEKGIKGRLTLITFLALLFFVSICNVHIEIRGPDHCHRYRYSGRHWNENGCELLDTNWGYEQDAEIAPWIFLFATLLYVPYTIYFATRAVGMYRSAMADSSIYAWKQLSRFIETDEQLPTMPLCDHPSDPRYIYREEFDAALERAAAAVHGEATAHETPIDKLLALENSGKEGWRQDTFHEPLPWMDATDVHGAYFALKDLGAIEDEEDFCSLIQQGRNILFDRPFPQDFCDTMEFWRNVYKLWLLAHAEAMRPAFERLLQRHLPDTKLGPRKTYSRLRMKELHHSTGSMRDVQDHHLDQFPSAGERTISANVHDVLRARLVVETPDEVMFAVEKVKALTYPKDGAQVLFVENDFRSGECRACREVRVYLCLKELFKEGARLAVAELQIRLAAEDRVWERVHVVQRAMRGDFH